MATGWFVFNDNFISHPDSIDSMKYKIIERFNKLRFEIYKVMAQDICQGVKFIELYPATSPEGIRGIYCETIMGGSKFWSENELSRLFVRNNQEWKRFRL